jgi:outer membrane protein assembly factor BamB
MKYTSILALTLVLSSTVKADDWPHWMGPSRDNVWHEDGLLDKFPDGGPKVLWRTPIAGGYAGPAVSGGKVFITDYVTADDVKVANFERNQFTGTERILCLDEATGKQLWKHEYPVKYDISYPAGPRCTPGIRDGKVYTLGAEGHLLCLNADNGKVIWQKDLKQEFGTKSALWGYAAHPLIDGQKLITLVGGKGTHAVAFDKDTGAEIWRTLTAREQGYSPPTIVTAAGVRQLLLLRPDAVSSVDPETGKELWSVPYEASSGSIIMSPLFDGRYLFVAGYSNKNMLLELSQSEPAATVVWQDRKKQAMSPINVQPFLEGDTVYGFDQDGYLYAMDLKSGDRLWKSAKPFNTKRAPDSGTAFITKQGDRFWMFNELGELLITKLSRDGYAEIDRAKVIEPSNVAFGRDVVWSVPAWANRHAYIRNDKEIIAVDLSR